VLTGALLAFEDGDVLPDAVHLGPQGAVVESPDASPGVEQDEVFGVEEVASGAVRADGVAGEVVPAGEVVDMVAVAGEQSPRGGIGPQCGGVVAEGGHAVGGRVDAVGEEDDGAVAGEGVLQEPEVRRHFGADVPAAGEEEVGDGDMSVEVPFGDGAAELVGELEGGDVVDGIGGRLVGSDPTGGPVGCVEEGQPVGRKGRTVGPLAGGEGGEA